MLGTPKRLIGLAVALVVAVAAPAQAQTTLRYKFKEGENLEYVAETKGTVKLDLAGKELALDTSQTMDMAWTVKSVDSDGKAKIFVKMARVRFAMDTPMGKVEYDSKDDKMPDGIFGKMLGPGFKALAETEMTLTMDSRGEVSDVVIPEKVLKALKGGKLPGGDMLSPETLKKSVSLILLPKDAIAKGKSWNEKVSLKTGFGNMKIDNQYTYEGQVEKGGRKLEKIGVKPSIEIEADPNNPVAMKLKSGEGKGTAYHDNQTGRLIEMTTTQNIAVEALGQTIEMVQTTSVRLNPSKEKEKE